MAESLTVLFSEIGSLISSISLLHSCTESYLLSKKFFSVKILFPGLLETRAISNKTVFLLKQVKQALFAVSGPTAAISSVSSSDSLPRPHAEIEILLQRALTTLGEVEKHMLDKSATEHNKLSLPREFDPNSAASLPDNWGVLPTTNISFGSQPPMFSPELNLQHPIVKFLNSTDNHRIVAIVGTGGVGKTTLMRHLSMFQYSTFVAFVELVGDEPDDQALIHAQASMLMQLSGPVREFNSLVHGRVALKERVQDLAAMGKSFCIAIDNVWRTSDLEKLLSGVLIPSALSCIMITSRIRNLVDDLEDLCERNVPRIPYKSMVFEQEPMQFTFARRLLLAQVSPMGLENVHEKMLDEICTYCEGIPLLLKTVGGLLARAPLNSWEFYKRMIMEDDWIPSVDDEIDLRGIFERSYKKLRKNSQEALCDIASFLHRWSWDTVQTLVGVEAMEELSSFHLIKSINQQVLASEESQWHTNSTFVVSMYVFIRKLALSQRIKDWGTMDLSTWLLMDDQFLKIVKHLHLNVDTVKEKVAAPTLPVPGRCFSLLERLRVLELSGTFQSGAELLLPASLLYLKLTHNNLISHLSNVQVPSSLRHFELERCEQLLELPLSIYECNDLQILRIFACPVLRGFRSVSNWHCLRELHLESCNGITQLPEDLEELELLTLHGCINLQALPRLPSKKLARIDIQGCPYISTSAQVGTGVVCIDHEQSTAQSEEANPQSTPVDQVNGLEALSVHSCGNLQKLSSASVQLKLHNCTCRKLEGLGLESMTSLRKIKLEYCPNLVRLPNSICTLKYLVVLDLHGCLAMEQLPLQLGDLSALQRLGLHNCVRLKRLPDSISGLTLLTELNLIGCTELEELPEELGCLSSLRLLRLAKCQSLTGLPDSICNLRSLSRLDLHGCEKLQWLPKKVGKIAALETLLLMECHSIRILPDSICKLSSLSVLSMNGCMRLKALPDQIGRLRKLLMLSLAECSSLTNLGKSISKLSSLMVLDLQRCLNLKGLPEGFGSNQPVLEIVLLKECHNLTSLPESFCKLKSLKELDLSGCSKLERLPDKFGRLSSLRTLRLSDCEVLKELPDSICQLKSLVIMDLQGCYMLEELPRGIGSMKALQELMLLGCATLAVLPASVRDLKSLRELDMRGSWIEKVLGVKEELYFVGGDKITQFLEFWCGLMEQDAIFEGAQHAWTCWNQRSVQCEFGVANKL